MRRFTRVASLIVIGVLLAACSSMGARRGGDAAVEDRNGEGASTGASGVGIAGAGSLSGRPWEDPSSPLSQRIIYFDYDSNEVRPADRDIIAAHAQYLVANPQVHVTLEGHADERGSREYNIGLGERRAQAVRSLMTIQGVPQGQITTVSYGEEKPAVDGHDEYAWQQNRRVEIVYPVR